MKLYLLVPDRGDEDDEGLDGEEKARGQSVPSGAGPAGVREVADKGDAWRGVEKMERCKDKTGARLTNRKRCGKEAYGMVPHYR